MTAVVGFSDYRGCWLSVGRGALAARDPKIAAEATRRLKRLIATYPSLSRSVRELSEGVSALGTGGAP